MLLTTSNGFYQVGVAQNVANCLTQPYSTLTRLTYADTTSVHYLNWIYAATSGAIKSIAAAPTSDLTTTTTYPYLVTFSLDDRNFFNIDPC